MIIGCGFPQLNLLRFCKSNDIAVVGVDANQFAVGRSLCDWFVNISTTNIEGVAKAAVNHGVDAVTTCGSDHAVLTAAEVADATGSAFYANPDQIRKSQQKPRMRQIFREAQVPNPAFCATRDRKKVTRFIDEQGLPVIIKPARGWGQRGVRQVERFEEVDKAFSRAKAASLRNQGNGVVLVEAYIDGSEYSVNTFTVDGDTTVLCITERIITSYPDPPGITYAEVYPSGLDQSQHREVRAAAILAVEALGLRNGPAYTQLRYSSAGPVIIETALRMGGGLDPDVTFYATGISLYRMLLGLAFERQQWIAADPEGAKHGGVIGKFLVAEPGVVQKIQHAERARGLPGIIDVTIYRGPGDMILPLTNGARRAGHILAVGDDRADAECRASAAASLISISTGSA